MGVGYNPKIVTNGLILCVDSINRKSYPGSGTTWTDISAVSPAITLQSGITYNSGGFLTFDGTSNGYADFSVSGLSTVVTIEMLVKLKTFSSAMPLGWGLYDIYGASGAFGYNTANSDVYGLSASTVTNLGLLNNWKHYVFEMRSDVSYTNNKIYVNSQSQTLSQVLGSENTGARTFNSGNGRLAGWRNDTGYRMSMDLAVFRVYNRILSVEEIQQNFNALRGRFDI